MLSDAPLSMRRASWRRNAGRRNSRMSGFIRVNVQPASTARAQQACEQARLISGPPPRSYQMLPQRSCDRI